MLKSESSKPKLKIRAANGRIAGLCLFVALLGFLPSASAQVDFTLQATSFNPDAVPPGGQSSSNITVTTPSGYIGTINLACTVTSSVPNIVSLPQCQVSPSSLSASGGASATITTTTQTSTVRYSITITGTDASGTQSTQPLGLTVLSVTPQFTITVQTAVAPTSVPAGSGAQGIITVNPINGYSSPGYPNAGVTLSCSSITPLVTIPPACAFSYPPGKQSLPVSGVSATSTLTISTFGPVVTTAGIVRTRGLYAVWLPLPMLALVGLGAAVGGKRSRKAWGLLGLFVVSGALLLMPACGNTTNSTTTPNGVTPANTYTLTVVGVDSNGVISSNASTTSSNPTVSLTVTAPPK